MGDFPSGQRGQTVNLLATPSVVRIHHRPSITKCRSGGTGRRTGLKILRDLYSRTGSIPVCGILKNQEKCCFTTFLLVLFYFEIITILRYYSSDFYSFVSISSISLFYNLPDSLFLPTTKQAEKP